MEDKEQVYKTLKRLLLPLASAFLIYQTIGLVHVVERLTPERMHLWQALILAFLITLFITGVFAFLGFAFPTHKILPVSYFKIRNAERLKKTYRLLGVDRFKKMLLFAFWGREKNKKKFFNGTRSGIQNFIYQSKQSEIGHLLPLIVSFLLSLYFLYLNQTLLFTLIMIINIIGNFYPIILQRHHRIRMARWIKS